MIQSGFLNYADCIIECCQEKIKQNGEDSYYTSLYDNAGIVSVFDGCGGSGAKKYQKFQNKTGAYMSSRVVAGATKDWFAESFGTPEYQNAPALSLKKKIKEYLSICKEVGDEASALKGLLAKDFPTTASIIIATTKNGINIDVLCLSVGDSRCYMLSSDGLMQLTEDDLGNVDAMDNLTTDAVLTNVITTSKDFEIHQKRLKVKSPCILFTATDGCFGYLSTPMEFEYLLINTLLEAQSVVDLENKLKTNLIQLSGDDFSFTGLSIGFGSFQAMQNSFRPRADHLRVAYISKIKDATLDEKKNLWRVYKSHYELFLHNPEFPTQPTKEKTTPLFDLKPKGSLLKPPSMDETNSLLTCPNCKKQISRAKFCPFCGEALLKNEKKESSVHAAASFYRPDDLD